MDVKYIVVILAVLLILDLVVVFPLNKEIGIKLCGVILISFFVIGCLMTLVDII